MNYFYINNSQLEIELPDPVFELLQKAVKMNSEIDPKSENGKYWRFCVQMRIKTNKISVTLKQLEDLMISSLQPFLYNFEYSQVYREFVFDVERVLNEIFNKAEVELKTHYGPSLKYTTSIVFI